MAQYLFYKEKLRKNIKVLNEAFKNEKVNFKLFYSVKTNNFKSILQEIHFKSNSILGFGLYKN